MKDHLPPSAPIRTHYHFGTDIPIPENQDTNEMAAFGEPDEFTGDGPRGWVVVAFAVLAWAMLIYGVYLAMTLS